MDSKEIRNELANFIMIAKNLLPFPDEIANIKGMNIYGKSIELSGEIGGDHIIYLDFKKNYNFYERIKAALKRRKRSVALRLSSVEKRMGFLIADIAGHRVTDALIALMLHQSFLVGVQYELKINGMITPDLFENLNNRFYDTLSDDKFVTMIYGEISASGKIRFISLGHPPPVVFSAKYDRLMRTPSSIIETYLPLGVSPSIYDIDNRYKSGIKYQDRLKFQQIELLGSGDILIAYTDGLLEHGNSERKDYFPGEMERVLRRVKNESAKDIYDSLKESILGYAQPSDDISFIIIKKD
ncbi:MAG: serine/threonine-protein phosphatase [Spirochaetales bacterium]|nr:serine/threonine-protein phosphatase [Spirochaetales bacterium]